MSTTEMTSATAAPTLETLPFALEVVVIPVADFDRARDFYRNLGWRVDVDVQAGGGGEGVMHLTPPGSQVSVLFGSRVTAAQPGSFDGLLLAVRDIDEARDALIARGVDVGEVFHAADGGLAGGFHVGEEGRAPGHDPQRRSYASYASFNDSEGNRWILQELTERLPGRV